MIGECMKKNNYMNDMVYVYAWMNHRVLKLQVKVIESQTFNWS